MALHPQHDRDGLPGALAIHLCIYLAVGGCFAFGFYELLQPARVSNPGLAAYQSPARVLPIASAPPREVLTYGATSLTMQSDPAAVAKRITAETEGGLETTGRSVPESKARSPSVIAPRVATMNKPTNLERRTTKLRPQLREVKPAVSQERRVACIARYDSSGAQTGAC
jgi:hypothetical protein